MKHSTAIKLVFFTSSVILFIGQANATIIVGLRQISRFGNQNDVRQRPYVGLDVLYHSLVEDPKYNVVKRTVLGTSGEMSSRPGLLPSFKEDFTAANSEAVKGPSSIPRFVWITGISSSVHFWVSAQEVSEIDEPGYPLLWAVASR